MDFLVVDLDEAAADEMRLGIILGDGDYLAESPGDDSFALFGLVASHHGVRLAATCLSVGEDGSVISIQDAVDKRKGTLLIDEALRAVGREDIVEGEALRLLAVVLPEKVNLVVLAIDFHDADAAWR
jgi:hypothetical protein